MQGLLLFKMRYGRTYVLARWTGSDASGDTWEPLDKLNKCKKAIAVFEQAPFPDRRRRRRRQTSALRGTADTLLAASYGARWVLVSPNPSRWDRPGPAVPRPPALTLNLVCGSGS